MWKNLVTAGLFVGLIYSASWAQTEQDALRYSLFLPKGSSRSLGLSGAIGAIGADMSSASGNVAGLGLFRKSQISITTDLYVSAARSTYYGSTYSDNKVTAAIGNGGILYSKPLADKKNPKGLQFMNLLVAYNKLADFNKRTYFQGRNDSTSFLQPWLQTLNGGTGSDFYENLGVASQLFLQDQATGQYFAFNAPWPNFTKNQEKSILGRGSLGELNLAGALNLANKLYMGLGVNVQFLNYRETAVFTESEVQNDVTDFKNYSFEETFSTRGAGFNGRLGIIYRPVDLIRIGVSFQTPTAFTLTDRYQNKMTAVYDNDANVTAESPEGFYRYRMTTPLRVQGSLAFIFGKRAMLGMDYEYVPNKSLRFRDLNGSMLPIVQSIPTLLQGGHNVKLGAEYKIGLLALRAGGLYSSSITQVSSGNPVSLWGLSGGLGVRTGSGFFFDFAYQFLTTSSNFWPYSPFWVAPARIRQQTHALSATWGFAF